MYKILWVLFLTLFIIIQNSYVKKIEEATKKIEYQEERKSEIYKYVYSLYGFFTCLELILLVVLVFF